MFARFKYSKMMSDDMINKMKGLLWMTLLIQLLFAGECRRAFGTSMNNESNPNLDSGRRILQAPSTEVPNSNQTIDSLAPKPGTGVRVNATANQVVLDNGIIQVTFSVPEGYVTGIRYGGQDNALDITNKVSDRGYWDIASAENPDNDDSAEIGVVAAGFKILTHTENQVEISFLKARTPSVPLQIDTRYVLLRGHSGFYSYAIFERQPGWPAMSVDQIRTVYKPSDKFHYMAVSDKIQRMMPSMQDRDRGQPLAYKEAVLLTNPIDPKMKGEVDDKYQYACEDKDNKVHGWVSSNPLVGIWMITPSDEFRMGGPHKQDLTSHVGPTMLAMFHSTHYGGTELVMRFKNGEPWKKVFGPYLMHMNSVNGKGDHRTLWLQAKEQMQKEVQSWPYNFLASQDYPKADKRGSVVGKLLVNDGSKAPIPAKSGWVGLALPGEVGSWQTEMKGYQFWVQTDGEGRFQIKNVHPGTYNLYAWVPGFIGDFKSAATVNIVPGKEVNLGDQIFTPPRSGATLWEIGIPDRTAAEFFVPDPSPNLTNPLFLHDEENKYRQYGLWDRYTDLYPKQDLVYTVGVSNFRKDWFFAHVLRRAGEMYQPTTWQIVFPLKDVVPNGVYTLQIALASATQSEIQVRINNPDTKAPPLFTTLLIGRDNAIARHGIHGMYHLYSIKVQSTLLKVGQNTIFLTQSRHKERFRGVMYDYIRLEGPPSPK